MRVALIVGMTTKTYFASFNTPYDARAALYDLSQAGFDHNDIGIIAFGDENDPEFKSLYDMQDDKAPEGAVVGATTGAAAGGLVALGMAAGLIPGVGTVIAGGLFTAVLSTSATGALAGGITGALIGNGIKEEDSAYVTRELQRGRICIAARTTDPKLAAKAADIIERRHGSRRAA